MEREIVFRGKRAANGEWVSGCLIVYPDGTCYICSNYRDSNDILDKFLVSPETVGQFTGLTDKNGVKIFEGDIVDYNTYDDFDCHSVVKFGEYEQDGSGGEYNPSPCVGLYVEVDNFTCPDWAENDTELFKNYLKTQSLLEVSNKCEIIGNIHDNPEYIK